MDRHIVTKQRMPSIKSLIKNIEAQLAMEVNPKGKEQLEKYLGYWKRRQKEKK